MLHVLESIPAFKCLNGDTTALKSRAESVSKQLGAWLRTLRDSEMKGQRYVNAKVRRMDEAAKDRQEFLEELEQIRVRAAANRDGI